MSFKQLPLILLMVLLVSCNGGENQTNIELVQNMMDQESIKAQDWDPKQPGKAMMLVPPEGTAPKGFKPYPYAGKPVQAQENLKNPIAGNFTPEILEVGKKNYTVFCSICHGATGAGDGAVGAKMTVEPPSLINAKIKGYNDGRIYHIITDGQGVMSSYAKQIKSSKARWSIVNYVRTLQKNSESGGSETEK